MEKITNINKVLKSQPLDQQTMKTIQEKLCPNCGDKMFECKKIYICENCRTWEPHTNTPKSQQSGKVELPELYKYDEIILYGKKTTVLGFESQYNNALNPPRYEMILLTEGRGDPFERTLDNIKLIKGTPAWKRNGCAKR